VITITAMVPNFFLPIRDPIRKYYVNMLDSLYLRYFTFLCKIITFLCKTNSTCGNQLGDWTSIYATSLELLGGVLV